MSIKITGSMMSVGGLNSVPSHVVQQGVFPHFNAHDLARCAQVCKLWRTFASADSLWRQTMHSITDKLLPNVLKISHLPTANLKTFIDSRAINSRAKLLSYFKKFAQETGVNQRNRFICVSPFDSVYCVVDFGLGNIDLSGMGPKNFEADIEPDNVHLCFYMRDLEDFRGDNALQIKIVNEMGSTPNGEGSKVSNAFLVLPLGDARIICNVMTKRLEELQSQQEAWYAMYGIIGLVIGMGAGIGITRGCTLF